MNFYIFQKIKIGLVDECNKFITFKYYLKLKIIFQGIKINFLVEKDTISQKWNSKK